MGLIIYQNMYHIMKANGVKEGEDPTVLNISKNEIQEN